MCGEYYCAFRRRSCFAAAFGNVGLHYLLFAEPGSESRSSNVDLSREPLLFLPCMFTHRLLWMCLFCQRLRNRFASIHSFTLTQLECYRHTCIRIGLHIM